MLEIVRFEMTHVKFKRKRKSWVSSERSMSPTSGPRGITSSSASAMAILRFSDVIESLGWRLIETEEVQGYSWRMEILSSVLER